MNKWLAALLVAALAVGASAGWYVWLRPHDRLALARNLMAQGDARAAKLALRGALQDDPANAEAHFRLGEVQLRLGDPVAAETQLTEARQRGWDARAIEPKLARAVLSQGRDTEVLASFHPDGLPPDQAADVLATRSAASLGLHRADAARDAAAQAERLDPHATGPALASARAAAALGDQAAAEQAVGRALAIDPRSAAALLLQAEQRHARGDAAGTLASLDAAIAAAPDFAAARLARAQLLLGAGQDARARADVAVLLQNDPRSPLANYLQAQLLIRARDFAAADAALQAVGPALSRLPRGEMLLAVVKANLRQPEQAAEAAAHYLGHAPADPAAYKLVASIALAAGRATEAADVLDRAVAAGHADAETYDLLGQADARSGRGAAALAAMQQAAALAPGDPAILTRLATLRLGAGDASHAARDLQRLLATQPVPTPAPQTIADTGQTAPAAAANPPTPAQTAAELVVASLQAAEPDRAAAALERLRTLEPDSAQLESLTGLVRLAQLDFPGARAAFEAAVKRDPSAAAARINLAGVLGLQGKQDDAEAELRQVLAHDPGNLAALSALEQLLLGTGRRAGALAALEAAHASAKGNPLLTAALADLYDRADQPARALAMLDADADAARHPTPGETPAGSQGAALVILAARARAQQALGQHHAAEDSLRRILTAQPRDLAIRRQLIDLLLADRDFAGAQAVIADGLAAQPGNPALLAASVSAAAQAGGVQAGLDRADVLAHDPANLPAARLLKGEVYMAEKRYPEAAAAFTAELHGDAPGSVAVGAAQAEQAAGHPDRAASLLRDWLAGHPDATDVASALAVMDIGAKRLDAARTELQGVLDRQPNNPAALNNLAWVEQRLHQPEQAKNLAQRSWLLSPTPQAADTLGWILLGGDHAAPASSQAATALGLLRNAAASLPDDPDVQYHYAVALNDNGQHQPAAAILTKLLAGHGPFADRAQAQKLLDALPHT